jgi:hypothetical protein
MLQNRKSISGDQSILPWRLHCSFQTLLIVNINVHRSVIGTHTELQEAFAYLSSNYLEIINIVMVGEGEESFSFGILRGFPPRLNEPHVEELSALSSKNASE